ncbi:MAG: murein transglycosylase domain-containing protein [Gallionellaceae bacterium]
MRMLIILPLLFFVNSSQAGDLEEFEAYKQKEKAEFRAYTEKMQQEWKDYLADIKKNFGSTELTSDKKWVGYAKNNKSKVSLDYDKGVVTVEFVADEKNKAERIKEVKKLLQEQAKEVNPFSQEPMLTENIPLDKIKLDTVKPKGAGGQEGEKVYSLTIPLNEDRQENNEIQIAESVRDATEKYKVSYDLAMAIIKTESNFNIGAGSKKGALDIRDPAAFESNPWGLMQVVPQRSGRGGWKRAKKQDRMPTAEELLNPKLNLEIGVAYLAVLQDSYFNGVKDDKKREMLMISAYHESPEKVFGVFSAKGKKEEAVAAINKLTQEEVKDRLSGKKGANASGQYVAKVEKERSNYRVEEDEKIELENIAKKIVKKPELLATVNEWLGTPYRLGSNSRSAIDCSGFTMNVYSQTYKMKLPRTSDSQYKSYGGATVDSRERQEGDLIYFKTVNSGNPVSHVGVWLDGRHFAHASSSKGVIISDFNESPYWRNRYVGANRPLK